ncbi:MAG: PDZ domain-containing protein, partial [Verrucomicrobiales bacterium]
MKAILVMMGSLVAVAGGQTLPSEQRTNGDMVREAFDPAQRYLQESSAVLYEGRSKFIYATVVSEDGYLLTKASELEGRGEISVRIGGEFYGEVEVVSTNVIWDVALLKVEAQGLQPVRWDTGEEATHGTWVVSNGSTTRRNRRLRVGVISANAHEVSGKPPVILGVGIKREEKGVLEIARVGEDSGAEKAGMKEGDIILSAEGCELADFDALQQVLKGKLPGDVLSVRVRRGEEELDLEIELMKRPVPEERHMASRNDQMSGRFSRVRDGFPRVIQHASMMSEETMDGP